MLNIQISLSIWSVALLNAQKLLSHGNANKKRATDAMTVSRAILHPCTTALGTAHANVNICGGRMPPCEAPACTGADKNKMNHGIADKCALPKTPQNQSY